MGRDPSLKQRFPYPPSASNPFSVKKRARAWRSESDSGWTLEAASIPRPVRVASWGGSMVQRLNSL